MPDALRPELERVHELRRRRTPGSITRVAEVWDACAGVRGWPGQPHDAGPLRGALWRDEAGEVQGAVAYKVVDHWERNRPAGKAEVTLLVGATPEAERELWRHLCEIDWVATVTAGNRGVDDPLQLMLADGRRSLGSTCSTASGRGCSTSPPRSARGGRSHADGSWSRSPTRRASRPGGGASSSRPTAPR